MKKLELIFLLILLFNFSTYAQEYSKVFGKVGKAEFDLQTYKTDPDAEAVVFFDIGKSYFVDTGNGFDIIFERSTRIKILSEAGLKWAEVEIPYYQEGGIYEKILEIKAYTYNYENGVIDRRELDVSNTYDEKINNSWLLKKFAIPNVKVGSIIEFKYELSSQYKFNLRDWEFQWRIPVVYSEYEVKLIPFYQYTWLLQGASKFDEYQKYESSGLPHHFGAYTFQDMVHKYVMKDVPAFESEQFITSINDYILKIDFQLSKFTQLNGASIDIITTWEEMSKDLLKHTNFGKYAQKAEKSGAKVFNVKEESFENETEKFNRIIDYVKSNYKWDGNYSLYTNKTVDKFISQKHGNVSELNLFTCGLLNANGIEAYPVLISTRKHGKIKIDYPFTHFFNYVIIMAKVDGNNLLCDATEIFSPNNRLPERCINDKGLVIKKGEVDWVGLECMFMTKTQKMVQVDGICEGLAHSQVKIIASEYDALRYRNNYTDDIEKFKKYIEGENIQVIDSTIDVKNQTETDQPFILSYCQTYPLEITNNKIYFSPFAQDIITENPLKETNRSYPIDMIHPGTETYNTTIKIPENYKVDYLPSDLKINNNQLQLNYTTTQVGGILNINFTYSFKQAVYDATDLKKLKFFFDDIIKKGNEKVVFVKM